MEPTFRRVMQGIRIRTFILLWFFLLGFLGIHAQSDEILPATSDSVVLVRTSQEYFNVLIYPPHIYIYVLSTFDFFVEDAGKK